MIVYDDNIELKRSLLRQGAGHGFGDSPFAVANRNDNAGAHRKSFGARTNGFEARRKMGADASQVLRRYLLHFALVILLTRIDIVKLALTGFSLVGGRSFIERFGNPHQIAARQFEPEI